MSTANAWTFDRPANVPTAQVQTKANGHTPLLDAAIAATPEYQSLPTFDSVERMARKLVEADWVPLSYKRKGKDTYFSKEEIQAKVEVAIMHGADVGLSPIQAVQGIAIINGVPAIWGDALIGVCLASGLVEDFEERMDRNGDGLKAVCRVRRKGIPTEYVRSFSIKQAQAAGLTNKPGPWKEYTARMLQMRARSLALRDAFADRLKGLHSAEEAQDGALTAQETQEIIRPAIDMTAPFSDATPPLPSDASETGDADPSPPAASPAPSDDPYAIPAHLKREPKPKTVERVDDATGEAYQESMEAGS